MRKLACNLAVVCLASLLIFRPGSTLSAGGPGNTHAFALHSTACECCIPPTPISLQAIAEERARRAIHQTEVLLQNVRETSYAELCGTEIGVRTFHSSSDYFRTRVSLSHYLTFRKMQFFLEINPLVFELKAPDDAVKAIIAHELEHILYLSQRNRIKMFSLMRLAAPGFTVRFERRADLGAIGRGYGPGLIVYRQWLYQNIPRGVLAEKRRDYFSPEEISAIQLILRDRPQKLAYWLKHVPRNLEDIRRSAGGVGAALRGRPNCADKRSTSH